MKKLISMNIPTSICNLRCHYCYIAQRLNCFEGVQPVMKYTPDEVAKGLSAQRLGGAAFINICAAGETLLTKDFDLYLKAILQEGHYCEVVSNMTITYMIDKILSFDKELLNHLEFKCSFHYLELKKKNLLDTFSSNVNRAWEAGASISIEVTPSDELIPYIDELKEFSMTNFGALPHLTIARNDNSSKIEYLTNLSQEEYQRVWEQFDSPFWEFKRTIFGQKRNEFCYAGSWSRIVDLSTGVTHQCYGQLLSYENVFENPEKPFPDKPIGKCCVPHCYNGHAWLTLGLIPDFTDVKFGDIRNRRRADGENWLHKDLYAFFNGVCLDDNERLPQNKEKRIMCKAKVKSMGPRIYRKLKVAYIKLVKREKK